MRVRVLHRLPFPVGSPVGKHLGFCGPSLPAPLSLSLCLQGLPTPKGLPPAPLQQGDRNLFMQGPVRGHACVSVLPEGPSLPLRGLARAEVLPQVQLLKPEKFL